MSPVSVVLFFLSLHDVVSWLSSWLLNIANFLMTFLSLKSHVPVVDGEARYVWHADHNKLSVVGTLS